jgi:CMP/dCMP kinase
VIIAVDGPAASGKGTIARALAAVFSLPYLDTGLLYRAVGIATLRAGGDPQNAQDALASCGFSEAMLHDPDIRTEAASRAASMVSAHQIVRDKLLARQQNFASQPVGAVLDGRDIGSVIAPKLFVTATAETRAARRTNELTANGMNVEFAHVLVDIKARDERDASRSAAPLRQAEDADLLDTTDMSIEEAVQQAIRLVTARLSRRQK